MGKAKARWKALPLSHTFYSAGGMDQAVCGGIEELTDYTLLSKGKKEGKVKRKTLSAPPMKGDERMVEVKKRKVEGEPGVEEVLPAKKSKKKNTFNVVDVDQEMEEKDFLKLSRSQVVEEDGDGAGKKKKKKNRKSAKNKPAINLAALGGISTVKDKENLDEKRVELKEGSTKSQQVAKEKTEKKKTSSEKAEKIKEKKAKK